MIFVERPSANDLRILLCTLLSSLLALLLLKSFCRTSHLLLLCWLYVTYVLLRKYFRKILN